MSKIDISIITVSHNSSSTIEDTLKSVFEVIGERNCFEYIIQDSLSNDNTLEIAKKYLDKIPNLKIFSEKDSGIYDGMNKAIEKCSGDHIIFLNSDDILLENFNDFLEILFLNKKIDAFFAPVYFFKRPFFKIIRVFLTKTERFYNFKRFIYSWCPPHPGFICKLEILKSFKFNLSYKIASDYDQILRIILSKQYKFKTLHKPLIAMATGGKSNTFKGFKIAMKEMILINRNYNFNEKLIVRYFRNFLQLIIPFFFKRRFGIIEINNELKKYK